MTRDQRQALELMRAHRRLMILPSSSGKGARVYGQPGHDDVIFCHEVILFNLAKQGLVRPREPNSYIFELTDAQAPS